MKKIFTFLLLGVGVSVYAQTFALYKTAPNGSITNTITNGGGYTTATTTNSLLEEKVLIKNTSAATHTYNVIRSIVVQNPTLILDGSSNTPNTYFCFGYQCFGSSVSQPSSSDYTILGPAGSTSEPYDNSKDNGTPFVLYFSEGAQKGHYVVRYKVYNIADAADTIAFTVTYNSETVGIKTIQKSDLSFEIFPNPSHDGSAIFITLNKSEELQYQLYNSLGSIVYSNSKQKYSAGKNQLSIGGDALSDGVYFISLSNGQFSATRKLIISK